MILQASLILVLVFAVLLAVGIPIAISIAVSSLATILLILPIDIAVFSSAQKMVASIDSFSLIAVPFFILSGIIMNNGGIAAKLVDFSKLLAGRVRVLFPIRTLSEIVCSVRFPALQSLPPRRSVGSWSRCRKKKGTTGNLQRPSILPQLRLE